jgi:hypothetical protein
MISSCKPKNKRNIIAAWRNQFRLDFQSFISSEAVGEMLVKFNSYQRIVLSNNQLVPENKATPQQANLFIQNCIDEIISYSVDRALINRSS